MIYFDNAATTLTKPPCVIDAVGAAMTSFGGPGRGAHDAAMAASMAVFEARAATARLFGATGPQQVSFCNNATEALNIALFGLLKHGDHVVTTTAEHNSVLRPLYLLEQRGVIRLTIIETDSVGMVQPDAVRAALRPETRAVVCTHGSNVTGNVMDIRTIGAVCRESGIVFIVDAAQTAGLVPIDMTADNIDILCFTGHKSLYGPQGTGGLCVRPDIVLQPLKVGGSGFDSYSHSHPSAMPEALEAGTVNAHGIAGLAAGIGYVEQRGVDTLRAAANAVAEHFVAGVRDLAGITLYGNIDALLRTPVVSLNIGTADSSLVSDALNQRAGICTRPGAHCAPLMHGSLGTQNQGTVRFSFCADNTIDQADAAIAALAEMAAQID